MFAILALAAALQKPNDVYTDDAGCRWKRRPPVAAKPASGAVKRKVSKPGPKQPAKAKPAAPDDEFIGCGPDGFGVWRSDLEPVEPIPELVPPVIERLPEPVAALPAPPTTFDEGCDCEGLFIAYPVFVGGGGGGGWVPGHTPPVPEPETWLLLLIGGVVLARVRRA